MNKQCIICGKTYFKKPTCGNPEWGRRKYCSHECQIKGLVKTPLLKKCQSCGIEFRRHSNSPDAKFCSNKCHGVGNRRENHPTFGKKITGEWLENLSRSHIGCQAKEKHPRWKGGITPINKQIRESREYEEWRKSVFERDNYICCICGQVGGYLHADHIKRFTDYPELRFDINNGQTLCIECHKEKTRLETKRYWQLKKLGA